MAGESASPADHLLNLLEEVRRQRREQPGLKPWFDAQEACLTGLIRRVSSAWNGSAAAGGGPLTDGAACLSGLAAEALIDLVGGTALRDELGYLVRAFRWRKRAPEATAVPMTLWEGCGAVAEREALDRAAAGDDGGGTDSVVPSLLAAVGEPDGDGVEDRLCLAWLGELSGGRRRWRFLDAAGGEGIAVRARLRVLLRLLNADGVQHASGCAYSS